MLPVALEANSTRLARPDACTRQSSSTPRVPLLVLMMGMQAKRLKSAVAKKLNPASGSALAKNCLGRTVFATARRCQWSGVSEAACQDSRKQQRAALSLRLNRSRAARDPDPGDAPGR